MYTFHSEKLESGKRQKYIILQLQSNEIAKENILKI